MALCIQGSQIFKKRHESSYVAILKDCYATQNIHRNTIRMPECNTVSGRYHEKYDIDI